MLENILKLNGTKAITRKELKTVNGGYACKLEGDGSYSCPRNTVCDWDTMLCRTPEDIYG